MSIFIRGVEKPGCCLNCPAFNVLPRKHGDCLGTPICLYAGRNPASPLDAPPDWCPIEIIPGKHGRLIDAAFLLGVLGKLKERVKESPEAVHAVKWAIQCLDKMPTIIEEEGD